MLSEIHLESTNTTSYRGQATEAQCSNIFYDYQINRRMIYSKGSNELRIRDPSTEEVSQFCPRPIFNSYSDLPCRKNYHPLWTAQDYSTDPIAQSSTAEPC